VKVLQAAAAAMAGRTPAALCTVIGVDGSSPRERSARMLVYGDGEIVGTIGGGNWEHRVIDAAISAIAAGVPRRYAAHLTRDLGMCCGGAMEVFIEPLELTDTLHLFGAGHVARPLAALARDMGFDVRVYDDRDEWLTEARFPGVERVLQDPRRVVPTLTDRDYVVLVTHSHQLDQDLLLATIEQPYAYLGMIGSRAKVAKFFVRLRAAGLDESLFTRVCAPVGLDIGAETPEEIAVAIAAELIRVRRGHAGPTPAMSEHPLSARGGDGRAVPPGLSEDL
jgi:xanthine dehydrogenase accessory factor